MKYQHTYYIKSNSDSEYIVLIDKYDSYWYSNLIFLSGFVVDSNNEYLTPGSSYCFKVDRKTNILGDTYRMVDVKECMLLDIEEYPSTLFEKFKAWLKR